MRKGAEQVKDREYLEMELNDLKIRRNMLVDRRAMSNLEYNVRIEEWDKQIQSIENQFNRCVQAVE